MERLLPESARRHDLTQSGFIQPMRDDADRANSAATPVSFKVTAPIDPSAAPAPALPPPRRVAVVEPPMDRLANPVTGYANLGRPRSVSPALLFSSFCQTLGSLGASPALLPPNTVQHCLQSHVTRHANISRPQSVSLLHCRMEAALCDDHMWHHSSLEDASCFALLL